MSAFRNFIDTPDTTDNQELSNKTLDTYQAKNTEALKNNEPEKTDAEYFDMVNPETGMRYEIPFLSYSDNNYYYEYVRYMKMKEQNPEMFQKILNWD